jgi:hypothetical protein
MKRKILPIGITGCILFFLSFTNPLPLIAQVELHIRYSDGTDAIFPIAEDDKLYFEESNLLIETNAQIQVNIPLAAIQKITVSSGNQTAIVNAGKKETLLIYPNPARDHIRIIQSATETVRVAVFSISGQVELRGEFSPGDPIDLSHLAPGLYFIAINNETFKFSKL